jgi:hypothetical protein
MNLNLTIAAALGACLAFGTGVAGAQPTPEELACAPARADVRSDCVNFMKTHTWNEGKGEWTDKATGKAAARTPEGVKTTAQIRAERNKFLASNKWDEGRSMWVPISGKGRDIGSDLSCDQTRAEVQADCNAFMRTHRFDEGKATYVPVKK